MTDAKTVCVLVEPTPEMIEAGYGADHEPYEPARPDAVWSAMLAAAPRPAGLSEGEVVAWRYRWKPTNRSEPGEWREPTHVRWSEEDRACYEEQALGVVSHPSATERMRAALETISKGGPDLPKPSRTYQGGFDQGCAWAGGIARAALAEKTDEDDDPHQPCARCGDEHPEGVLDDGLCPPCVDVEDDQ